MGRRLRKHSLTSISIVASIALVLVIVWAGVALGADPEPTEWLQNQGFEDFDDGGAPIGWELPADGTAAVVGAEDWADFDIYQTMGVLGPGEEPEPNQDPTPFLVEGGGDHMLRLGVPKNKDSHQVKGPISVNQTFESDGTQDEIYLVYRMFTWEHRSQDAFSIELKKDGVPWGQIGDSQKTGYYQVLPDDPPKGQKFTVSGWSEVVITGPDAEGFEEGSYTLTYKLSNTENASHDTWVYVDHVSHPPVAVFEWAPNDPDGEPPHEGDVIGLYGDQSYDPDPDGSVVKWRWDITNEAGQTVSYNDVDGDPDVDGPDDFLSPVGFIVPHDEADYYVKLTVWDNEGLSDETENTLIHVGNHDPDSRVNALDIEVLPGGTGQLVGRFLDPGWLDTHTATWSLKPLNEEFYSVGGVVQEDNLAPVNSGYVSGTFGPTTDEAGAEIRGTLTVTDNDGGVGSDQFTVKVIDPDPNLNETQDAFPAVRALNGDGAYLSYIQSQGDIDIFEVVLPDGGELLPMGTELLVTLGDLPANYDVAVFEGVRGSEEAVAESPQAAPFTKSQYQPSAFMHSAFMHSGFMHSAFMHSGFMHSGFMHSPFVDTGFMHSGFMHSGFMHSAFMHSPFADTGFMHSGFMHSAFMHSGFMHSGFMHSPIDGYPLSAMSFTGTEHDNTSGTDVSFDELGFDLDDLEALSQGDVKNLRVLGFSANLGTESEVVLATTGYPQTDAVEGHVYVAVKSATAAYSTSSPYTLQIETSTPLDPLDVDLGEQAPLVISPTSETDEVYQADDNPLTLFVTQFERLASLYSPARAEVVKNKLMDVADEPDVLGKIISVAGDPYADYDGDEGWDDKPWIVERANEVAQSIRTVIQDQLETHASIQYVVLVGNDQVIPFKRVIDQTIIGNEQNYTDQSFLEHPSATLASIANGYVLTDDYYVDAAPISWGGAHLYIPDMAISRLVEKPEEIVETIQAFIDADGTLSPTVGLVSGYDFMADGAENVRQILSEGGLSLPVDPVDLIGESWTGNDLRNQLLDDALGVDAANINAHFTHFAGLSPVGWAESVAGTLDDAGELLLSGDIAEAKDGDENDFFKGKLVFSMGCHAGLNVPDGEVAELSPESPITPALDFPQAMMQQGGIYLGSTGFGYGDTVGIAGTEALIGFFAEQLVGGGTLARADSVGLALAQAKQEYLGSLTSVTPYDQKSSVQFTLYGMPQYHLPNPTGGSSVQGASASSVSAAAVSDPGTKISPPFELSLSERFMGDPPSDLFSDSYTLRQHTGETGDYITADYEAEATADRPIHPVVPVDLNDPLDLSDQDSQRPAHGFVYTGGSYYNLPKTFQPAIARATTEWEVGAAEFQVATSEFWPVEPGSLTTRETDDGRYDQTFVAVPAQFKPTPGEDPIIGTERVWISLAAEVLTSTDENDWLAPTVSDVDLSLDDQGRLNVSVEAHDSSGISRIVVLQPVLQTATGVYEIYEMRKVGDERPVISDDGRYNLTGVILDFEKPEDIALLVQVVDGNGNVTRLTGRGALLGLRQPFNLGFEFGLGFWDVVEPVLGNASVVPASGEATGRWMLQLGTPTDKDAHQVKGITSVSQQFVADGGDIDVVYLLQSDDTRDWEFDDEFTISITDESGNLTYWAEVRNTQVSGEWERVAITGLTAGKSYTLTYTLDTTNSAAKNTWVYVDQGS